LYNLPTAGDVRRVRAQLATVEARLRDMAEYLEERDADTNGARPSKQP
jgi:hypothetical protein